MSYECVITGTSQDTIGYAGNSHLVYIICWLFGWQLHLYVNRCYFGIGDSVQEWQLHY